MDHHYPIKNPAHAWFPEARYGLFLHWGPSAVVARGEQSLFRDHMDHREFQKLACAWDPSTCDMREWARFAKSAGFRYAVLTTKHHDGYCLWQTKFSDYSSAAQAPRCDFVAEFCAAFRAEGLRVGLYYSFIDWRLPAYFEGPEKDPEGWAKVRDLCHFQVEELLTQYGQIDLIWFDGIWPRDADDLESVELVRKMRQWQPGILINNRLGRSSAADSKQIDGGEGAGGSQALGDFGTPEHHATAEKNRLWESCQVSTWRLWGFAAGERWRAADQLLDALCDCAAKGGNLLLNVGPDAEGRLPTPFKERATAIGDWLATHAEAVFQTDGGDLTEFVTRGYQTLRGNDLYLIIRFWHGVAEMRLPDLPTPLESACLITNGTHLDFTQDGDVITLRGLPTKSPTPLFPVIRLRFTERPQTTPWGKERLWGGDPQRVAEWARTRGDGPNVDGSWPADRKP
jgi:alpha-L-fucosidase